MTKIHLASDENHTYCFSCGAKYQKRMYPRWPIKIKFYRRFSIGKHGYQIGYTFGLVPVIATVIRFGWLRIVFGYHFHYGRGIGCTMSQEHGVVIHDDIQTKVPEVFSEYIEKIT